MADWSAPQDLVRFDDPYHAWAYLADHSAGTRSTDALCPVVIEILPENNTYASLIEALERFADEFLGNSDDGIPLANKSNPNYPFVVTGYDKAHFQRSMNWLEFQENGSEGEDFFEKTAYLRLYLVYAQEDTLFDRENNLWENPLFDILFAGRAVRNRATQEGVTEGASAVPKNANVELTIIDDSIAFLNDAFSTDPGTRTAKTRFRNIWFQDKERFVEGVLYEGARLNQENIQDLLDQRINSTEAELYRRGIVTFIEDVVFRPLDPTSEEHQPLAFKASHGTHVAATALRSFDQAVEAGQQSNEEPETPSVVDLNAITVPTFATQDTSGSTVASYIISAMRQAMLWNDERYDTSPSGHTAPDDPVPLVMNCSYGFTAGPKDGSHSLNTTLQRLLDARNAIDRPTALVVPMGNSYEDETVASTDGLDEETVASTGALHHGKTIELDWVVLPDDQTPSFLEIYARAIGDAPGNTDIKVDLIAPRKGIGPLSVIAHEARSAEGRVLREQDGPPLGLWSSWPPASGSDWSRRAVLALAPTKTQRAGYGTVPAGNWRLRITNMSETPIEVLAMIQRDDAPGSYPLISWQSYFEVPRGSASLAQITGKRTASVMASCKCKHVFVAGAGVGKSDDQDQMPVGASPYASAGPRLPQSDGPDATALADRSPYFVGIYGSGTYSGTQVLMSGSSVAAPVLAGKLAAKRITSTDNWPGHDFDSSHVEQRPEASRLGFAI